jgi:hypothetical protein
MTIFTGTQGRGAMRAHRARKREDAEARDAALSTVSPRRRQVRLAVDRLDQGESGAVDVVMLLGVVTGLVWLVFAGWVLAALTGVAW